MQMKCVAGSLIFMAMVLVGGGNAGAQPLSPIAIASADGKTLYVAAATGNKLLVVSNGKVTGAIAIPAEPTGLAISKDARQIYVTMTAPADAVAVIDPSQAKIIAQFPAGHGACAPVLNPAGDRLYVCSRYDNCVNVIDLKSGQVTAKIATSREPIAAALTADGAKLIVANHLPAMASDAEHVAAEVTVIDTAAAKPIASHKLPNGSSSLKGVAISPDGRHAAITHLLSRFNLPTTQLERGWMNTNAVSILDLPTNKYVNTFLIDDVDNGAANPWGAAWNADGSLLCIAISGTHEISLIDWPKVLAKLAKAPADDVPNDLSFLVDLRKRLKVGGNGPRSLLIAGGKAISANYFSDDLSLIDLAGGPSATIALGPKTAPSIQRKGEIIFYDATICFQQWQSCASCHPDTRVDGLNWDLLNDGIGNPKNTKNMVLSHRTPPAMSLGVRETAETAVRAGVKHILFAVRPEEEAVAMDEYLKSLAPHPSPKLVNGKLSEAAVRGQKIFADNTVGCANCHGGEVFTTMKHHDVGTKGRYDKDGNLDTPSLVEAWRTGPYLHDGSAATMRDVLTTHNKTDRHGKTSHLTKEQIDDLVEYLLSL